MPVSSCPSFSFCLVSRVISLNTRGGMWSRPVRLALFPRSKSGNFLTMCFQNSSCHQVSFFLLPIISLALSLPSSVSGTKQRCISPCSKCKFFRMMVLPAPRFQQIHAPVYLRQDKYCWLPPHCTFSRFELIRS